MRLPTMFVIPFIEYHAAFLFVCSLRIHHIWEIATKVGAMKRIGDRTVVLNGS
jgi:hypothetical protein